MSKSIKLGLMVAGVIAAAGTAHADTTPQALPYAQNWTSAGLVTTSDNWSSAPGVVGYANDLSGTTTGVDPRTITAAQTTVQVFANISGVANTGGGVGDFDTNVIALQGSGGADAPNIVVHVNTTGIPSVRLKYTLRDIDSTTDNTNQQFVVQYRVGTTGAFTNLALTYVADASVGPSLTNSVPYDVVLPTECGNVPELQLRFITTNAPLTDEWLGIDDLDIAATTSPTAVGAASPDPQTVNNNVTLTATVTPGTNPASTGVAVTCDLTSIGGSATQALGGIGGNVFEFVATVAAATSAGAKTFPCGITDTQTRTGSFSIGLTINTLCGNTVVEAGEGCDDGNVPGGSCSDSCKVENTFACTGGDASCASNVCDTTGGGAGICEAAGACGNGRVDGTDFCDDGGTSAGGGCSADCQLEDLIGCTANAQCDSAVCDLTNTPMPRCEPATGCGNSVIDGTDACDDGGITAGGGCSADCQIEDTFACTLDAQCDSGVCDNTETIDVCEPATGCGNSVVDGTDACDDGGTSAGGGCSADCQIENTFPCALDAQCDSGVCDETETIDVCEPATGCGNSVIDGTDACDDGGTSAGGGCSADCQIENTFPCTLDAQCDSGVCDNTETIDVCEPATGCGNSVIDGTDACDDGGTSAGGGCSADCEIENTFPCTLDAQCDSGVCDNTETIDVCEPATGCGNSVVDGTDDCDDGGTIAGGGCSADCEIENTFPCTTDGQCDSGVCDNTETIDVCEPATGCGNSVVDGTDDCDDGGTTAGGGCSADCEIENTFPCTTDAQCDSGVCDNTETVDVCEPAGCGNSVVEGSEYCDDGGTTAGGGCSADCQLENGQPCVVDAQCDSGACDNTETIDVCEAAGCGNSVVEGAEACDDGGTSAGGGCSADCQLETGVTCATDAECDSGICDETEAVDVCEAINTCGNSVAESGEGCDDGGLVAGNGCSGTCTVEPGFGCAGSPSVCAGVCGDGVVVLGEECDDDGTETDDGCDAGCAIEDGWTCTGAPSDCVEICGDGVIVGAEECDDIDTDDGDGCSATCGVEDGWLCDGEPSECSEAALCGDGVIDAGEECDDGNDGSDDGCDATCTVETGFLCEGEPSECVADADGDGIVNDDDNCPTIANPSQADDDDDGAGNACDPLEGEDEATGCCSTGDQGPTGAMVLLALFTVVGLRRRKRPSTRARGASACSG